MTQAMTTTKKGWSQLQPESLAEAIEYATMIAQSGMVPKDFINQPNKVLVAIQMGDELGLKPMQALQNIAVINGRPCVWGDALPAIVWSSGICEYIKEWYDDKTHTAHCESKRKGNESIFKASFSMEDAKLAGLLQKNLYRQYPKRMIQMRARAFCLRDGFSDHLKGLGVAEEQREVIDAEVVQGPDVIKTAAEIAPPKETQPPADQSQVKTPPADPPPADKPPANKKNGAKTEPKVLKEGEKYRGTVKGATQRGKNKASTYIIEMANGNKYETKSKGWFEAAKKAAGFEEDAEIEFRTLDSGEGPVLELTKFSRVTK